MYCQVEVSPFKQADSHRFEVIAQEGKDECGDEVGMVDHVKNLREVNHYCQSTVWGQGMVETLGYFMYEREEGRTLVRKLC